MISLCPHRPLFPTFSLRNWVPNGLLTLRQKEAIVHPTSIPCHMFSFLSWQLQSCSSLLNTAQSYLSIQFRCGLCEQRGYPGQKRTQLFIEYVYLGFKSRDIWTRWMDGRRKGLREKNRIQKEPITENRIERNGQCMGADRTQKKGGYRFNRF